MVIDDAYLQAKVAAAIETYQKLFTVCSKHFAYRAFSSRQAAQVSGMEHNRVKEILGWGISLESPLRADAAFRFIRLRNGKYRAVETIYSDAEIKVRAQRHADMAEKAKKEGKYFLSALPCRAMAERAHELLGGDDAGYSLHTEYKN